MSHLRLFWFLVAVGGFVSFWVVSSIFGGGLPASFSSDQALARDMVALCGTNENVTKKELCYEKNVPTLLDRGLSMERTFEVIKVIQSNDTGYQSCHVLAHLITSKEVKKDVSRWKEVVARSPAGICGNGAMHGAFQERYREESFPDESVEQVSEMLRGVCDPPTGGKRTRLGTSSCFHGVGHLLLYVTAANIQKTIRICGAIAFGQGSDFRQTCYEGAFMQIYQPLEPEDLVLIHDLMPKAKNMKTFCATFVGAVHNACVKEAWPTDSQVVKTPIGFETYCIQLGDTDAVHYCASGLIYPLIESLHYEIPTIEAFCKGMRHKDLRDICWARTAAKFVWADWGNVPKALSVCRDAPIESKDACWSELVLHAQIGMPSNAPETRMLCDGMPNSWRAICADAVNTAH